MVDLVIEAIDEHLGSEQFRYVATRAWWMAHFGTATRQYTYLAENLSQMWVPSDQGRDWLLDRQLTGRRTWLQGSHEQAVFDGFDVRDKWPTGEWMAPYGAFFAADEGREPCVRRGTWQAPTPGFLAELPRDPQELYEQLEEASPSDRPGYTGVLVYALDLLRTALVPADLRETLYRALLVLPGMTIIEDAENMDERASVALSRDDGIRRTEIFLDPKTAQFIGERNTLTCEDVHGLSAGTVTKCTSVSTAVVDMIGAMPPSV